MTVALADVKTHLRITHSSEDDYLEALIDGATTWIERKTRHKITTSTQTDYFNCLTDKLELSWTPIQSLDSITYIDTDGNTQTLSSDLYELDDHYSKAIVRRAYNATYPSTRGHYNDICVTYTAGYTTVPQPLQSAIIWLVGHWYANREATTNLRIDKVPYALESILWLYRSKL